MPRAVWQQHCRSYLISVIFNSYSSHSRYLPYLLCLWLFYVKFRKKIVIDFVALQLTAGSTTVMHLVMREQLPEPNNQGLVPMYKHLKRIYVYTFLSGILCVEFKAIYFEATMLSKKPSQSKICLIKVLYLCCVLMIANLTIKWVYQLALLMRRSNGEGENWPPALKCWGFENGFAKAS